MKDKILEIGGLAFLVDSRKLDAVLTDVLEQKLHASAKNHMSDKIVGDSYIKSYLNSTLMVKFDIFLSILRCERKEFVKMQDYIIWFMEKSCLQ